jgi:FemAB-related protein (PEP-CTERM system-associated)
VLPLVRQRSLIGDFLTSVPFFNYGGALADSNDVALQLMQAARHLASKLGCSYVEFRDVNPQPGEWAVRTDKAAMILQLPGSVEAFSKQMGSKLRSQVKRADREAIAVRTGGAELVDDFYTVFAITMRDLGTPVYPIRFFRKLCERFGELVRIVVIDLAGKPAAAGFLIMHRGRAEIPWAACRNDAKPLGLNMKLYWEVIAASISCGCTSFDFGRSTLDSGTFKFKKQWGAQPLQLHWHRWERSGAAGKHAEPLAENGKMRLATAVWRRLPVRVANVLGPLISPGLPW